MPDIVDEINEDLRREQARKVWEKYGSWIIALALVIVLGVGGWRAYDYWRARQAAQMGARFETAVALADEGKHAEAEAAFAGIVRDAPGGYDILARLRVAEEKAALDRAEGVKAFDAIAADTTLSRLHRDLAATRAALLLVDTAPYDEMVERMRPLTEEGRPFRHTARELLAFSAWRVKNETAARQWIDTILSDAGSPAGLRTRINVLRALLPPVANG